MLYLIKILLLLQFKGDLYLLQSRPITTLTNWTDFELTHEQDTPVITENSLYTIANTGEVRFTCLSISNEFYVYFFVRFFLLQYQLCAVLHHSH